MAEIKRQQAPGPAASSAPSAAPAPEGAEPTPAPEGAPAPKKKGCFRRLVIAAGILLAGAAVLLHWVF
jgi:hypothetical protein